MRLKRRLAARMPVRFGRVGLSSALAALAFAMLTAMPGDVRAAEAIEDFVAQIDTAPDGELTVTETLRVRAEGREIRRGIYRDFPLTFRDAQNVRRQVTFDLIDVTRDGRPEPHFTRRNGDGIRIYAGEEKVLLRPGTYTYRIRYRTGRQIRFLADHDELFWNVTGNDWAFPIQSATATSTCRERRAGALDRLYRCVRPARSQLARRGWQRRCPSDRNDGAPGAG